MCRTIHKGTQEMNEWGNEWGIYIALSLCIAVHQSSLQSYGDLSSTTTSVQHPQYNGASALTTHQLQVERRESDRANSVDGDY